MKNSLHLVGTKHWLRIDDSYDTDKPGSVIALYTEERVFVFLSVSKNIIKTRDLKRDRVEGFLEEWN